MSENLIDYLQVWGFENNFTVFSDGSFGFGFKLKPLDSTCWSADLCNLHSNSIIQFLNSLDANLDIQFIHDIKGGNSAVINKHTDKIVSVDPVIKSLIETRTQKYRMLDEEGLLPKHELYLFVRRKPQSDLLNKPKLFSKNTLFQSLAEDKLTKELSFTNKIAEDLESNLNQINLQPARLNSEEVLDLIYQQWNPSRPVGLGTIDPNDIKSGLLFSDVGINQKGFSIGDYYYRIISLKVLPDQTYATMSNKLKELPFNSKIFCSIHSPDQQKEIESLQTQRRIAFSMATGKKTGVSDLESEAKFKDLEQLLEQMVSTGEKIFHVSLQILIRAKSTEELDSQSMQVLAKFRDMGNADCMEETLAAFDIFSEIAIPNCKSKERIKRIKSSNLCDLLPIYSDWAGFSDPKILLRSRSGGLISFNPFDSSLTNSNQIVSGGSGSGKSFMTNILMMQILKDDPKVFIIDIGGSYKKICENFNGQYIPMGVDSDLSINPFDLAEAETKPSSQKVKFILNLIEIMTKENEQLQLGKLEKSEIESAIERVYETSKEIGVQPTLSSLKNELLKHSDLTIQKIGKILNTWTGNSAYGKFVDRPTTLKLDRSIVCFDLKGLESYPDLQSVCLFIITDFVWREVQRDRSQMKFLILDECWKLMENESASLFISEVFRTFRKYMASAIAISQTIDDFAKSKIANAILPNSSIKWILKQKGADKDSLRDVLSLNPTEVDLVSSLHQERGLYSEAFLIAEEMRAVVVIEPTALEYWLATTDGRDLGKIEEMSRQHPDWSQLQVLKNLSDKFPQGMAEALK
jgi:conjugal transfer ATP-binding protein TraC